MDLSTLFYLFNLVLVQGRTEVGRFVLPTSNHTHLDVYANALGRAHYNPWACNYKSEPGYRCISCSDALHCFPGNFALLVQCAGFLPYCRNGYCSRWETDGCNEEFMIAEGTHGPLRVTTPSSDVSTSVTAEAASESSGQVPDNNSVTTVPAIAFTETNKVGDIVPPADPVVTEQTDTTDIVIGDHTDILKPNDEKDPRQF